MQPLAAVLLALLATDGGVALLEPPPRDGGCADDQVPYAGQCQKKTRYLLLLQTLETWREQCATGTFKGCAPLGEAYRDGTLVPPSPEYAAKLFRRGCDGGDASACRLLGAAHRAGRGVEKDLARAARLFAQACEAGDGAACSELGLALERGEGVKADAKQARAAYDQACTAGAQAGCDAARRLDAPPGR